MKSLKKIYYVILAILTVAVLGCLIVWSWTKIDGFLYAMCALFAVYLGYFIFLVSRAKREKSGETESKQLTVPESAKTLFLSPYRKLKAGNTYGKRKIFYIGEFGENTADLVATYYDGSATYEDSERFQAVRMDEITMSFAQLTAVRGKTVVTDCDTYEYLKATCVGKFLKENEFVRYDEKKETL